MVGVQVIHGQEVGPGCPLHELERAERDFRSDEPSAERSARKLRATEIALAIVSMLAMEDRGFIPEVTVWATNPD